MRREEGENLRYLPLTDPGSRLSSPLPIIDLFCCRQVPLVVIGRDDVDPLPRGRHVASDARIDWKSPEIQP